MTRIVIAESGGNNWLVGGIEWVDELLFNTLPEEATIEFTVCGSQAELVALTEELAGPERLAPWLINPQIVQRLRGRGRVEQGVATRTVAFTPWSARIDDAGLAVVAAAAEWTKGSPAGRLLLRQGAADDPALADLQRLRARLVAAALARAGVDEARMQEETGEGVGEDMLDVVTQEA